jgi:hypothetical protein
MASPVCTVAPTVAGIAGQGQTLTAAGGTWVDGTPPNYSINSSGFEWWRCDGSGGACAAIPGATASTYVLTSADVGHTIRLYQWVSTHLQVFYAPSSPTAVVIGPPACTASPSISGAAVEDQTLTADEGTWDAPPDSYAYQWRRCDAGGASCSDIVGATASAYPVGHSDIGATFRVVVTATNAGGSTSATSGQTAVVTALDPLLPTISGSPVEGQVLLASDADLNGLPTAYTYRWRRCNSGGASCADIAAATDRGYVLRKEDVGSTIRVYATASNALGSRSAVSNATGVVAPFVDSFVALASYNCRAAWNTYQAGLLTFGYSTFDGLDVFAPSPFAATYLGPYDDLSDMLAAADVTIGRDSNLTFLPASTASIVLRDPTGLLNAENVDGPLYSSLLADRMHPITLEGIYGGETFPIFSGWIRGITWTPTRRKGSALLDCVDLTYFLNKAYPIIAAMGPTTTGAAIGKILDAIDWTDIGFRDLDVGDSIPDFSADGSETALSLIEGLLDCERGTFYIAPDGVATYRDRHWRQTLDSVALIEDEMSFVAPGVDFDAAITRARVTRLQSGYIAEADAPANDQRKLGWNDLEPLETPYLLADAGADSLANWLVWVLGQPRPPMHELAIDNRTAYQLYQMLARSFGERITVVSAQTGQSGDYHIEQIQHSIGGAPRHVCNLLVSRVIPKAIQFGVSAFDGADVFVY